MWIGGTSTCLRVKKRKNESFSSLDFHWGQYDQDKVLKHRPVLQQHFIVYQTNDTLVGAMPIYTSINNASEKKCLQETQRIIIVCWQSHRLCNNVVTQHPSVFLHAAEPDQRFTTTKRETSLLSPAPCIRSSTHQRPLWAGSAHQPHWGPSRCGGLVNWTSSQQWLRSTRAGAWSKLGARCQEMEAGGCWELPVHDVLPPHTDHHIWGLHSFCCLGGGANFQLHTVANRIQLYL